MPKSTEKRLQEQGISISEVRDYATANGTIRTMQRFGIRSYMAAHRICGDADPDSLPIVGAEISGRWFEGLVQSIMDHFAKMLRRIEELEAENERLQREVEYLRSFSDRGCIKKVRELMAVCK